MGVLDFVGHVVDDAELGLAGLADAAAESPVLGVLFPAAAVAGVVGRETTGGLLAPQVYAAQVAKDPTADTIGGVETFDALTPLDRANGPTNIINAANAGASPEEVKAAALAAANKAEADHGGPVGLAKAAAALKLPDFPQVPWQLELAIGVALVTVIALAVGLAVHEVRSVL